MSTNLHLLTMTALLFPIAALMYIHFRSYPALERKLEEASTLSGE